MRTIDVTNTGRIGGAVFIAVISGGAVGSFHLLDENCTGVLLAPGATCNAEVSFQPLSTGSKTAHFSLFGESDGGTQITLSGVGLPALPVAEQGAEPAAAVASRPAKSNGRAKARAQARAKARAHARAKARARIRAKRRRARIRLRQRHRRALRRQRQQLLAQLRADR